jgi:hypothetical protein
VTEDVIENPNQLSYEGLCRQTHVAEAEPFPVLNHTDLSCPVPTPSRPKRLGGHFEGNGEIVEDHLHVRAHIVAAWEQFFCFDHETNVSKLVVAVEEDFAVLEELAHLGLVDVSQIEFFVAPNIVLKTRQ